MLHQCEISCLIITLFVDLTLILVCIAHYNILHVSSTEFKATNEAARRFQFFRADYINGLCYKIFMFANRMMLIVLGLGIYICQYSTKVITFSVGKFSAENLGIIRCCTLELLLTEIISLIVRNVIFISWWGNTPS